MNDVVVVQWVHLCEPAVQILAFKSHIVRYISELKRVYVDTSDLAVRILLCYGHCPLCLTIATIEDISRFTGDRCVDELVVKESRYHAMLN
jgi:hypothetical protein